MSRAAEYAKKHADAKAVAPANLVLLDVNRDPVLTAMVGDDGMLVLVGRFGPRLAPDQALALSLWIADNFGDYGVEA